MEYQALYRKYRPQKFSDVVDQESILKIITNSIKENKISHAYLFSGPRGTGKTTIAKLVAKTINCLNIQDDFSVCGRCENCVDIENNSPDIIEIDAASNNGVDEIRELKSKINLVPSKLKYKVYIIDEVHMLSISAFNALLKTLEEPPSHVVFILATTEFYKVPTTIVSRCQCLNFTRIKTRNIESRLREISNLENINIEDEAIHEIALYSEGGMRDALGMLDKLASYSLEKITVDDFLTINGLISKKDMDDFIQLILDGNNEEVIKTLDKFDLLGYDFSKLLEKLMQELRDLLVTYYVEKKQEGYKPKDLYRLIMCLNETYNLLKEAANRRIIVEVKLLKFMNETTTIQELPVEIKKQEATELSKEVNKKISQEITEAKKNDLILQKNLGNEKEWRINLKMKQRRVNNTFAMASKALKNIALEKWNDINNYLIDPHYMEVAGLLKDCSLAVVSSKNMIIVSKYDAVIDKAYHEFSKVLQLIEKIYQDKYQIVFLTEDEFKNEVNNFKFHKNDKDYYIYKEEDEEFLNVISKSVEKTNEVCYGSLVDKAISIFGQENIEIE